MAENRGQKWPERSETGLTQRTRYFKDPVRVAASDPHAGYHKALVTSLPKATITVDVFHAVKLANTCVDDLRRRVQRETLGRRGRALDPLYGIRRLLTTAYERLSDRQLARVEVALRYGDPFDEVSGAWAVKEQLRSVYGVTDMARARAELATFYELAATAGTPEVLRLARTIRRWEPQGPQLLHDLAHQRPQRGTEPHHRKAASERPWDAQFRKLPLAVVAPTQGSNGTLAQLRRGLPAPSHDVALLSLTHPMPVAISKAVVGVQWPWPVAALSSPEY